MVSIRDRALVEARAAGIKPEELEKNHWRQMLRPDIVGPALGVSLFLLAYYIFVAFLVVYFSTVFGYSEAKANDLANWYWIANAIALVVAGIGSDRLKVRKPFMIAGAVVSLIGLGLFAAAATRPHTSYHTFAFYFVLVAGGSGVAYVGWMSAFTETVEKHNPAATATGLAVWGWIIRLVVTASFAVLTVVVPATNTLVNQGPKVEAIAAKYAGPIKTATVVGTPTLAALKANPANQVAQVTALARITGLSAADVTKVVTLGTQNKAKLTAADLVFLQANGPKVQAAAASLKAVSTVPAADFAYLQANAAKVQKANKNNPGQWQTWWWICFFGQLLFIPFVFLLTGRWSPKRASEDEAAHEALVASELERLHSEGALSA
jgi:ACS family D-galactonate transporter-like MFS transporter